MDFQEVIDGNAPLTDYLGNHIADALAGAAANLSAESEVVRRTLARNAALAFCTAVRIAITEAEAIKIYHNKTV